MRALGPTLSVVLVGSTAGWAGVTGQVSATGQGQAFVTGTGPQASASLTALLQENVGVHYAGLPFGPSVALLGAGVEAFNVNGFGAGAEAVSSRAATLDLSVGLLPRRGVPLRLFARGTLAQGAPQTFASFGGRESLAYGLSLNVEPGGPWPGLRLDAEEQRFTGFGTTTPLGDLRRVGTVSLSRSFGVHQGHLSVRMEQDQRTLSGTWLGLSATGTWLSPTHQTNLVGSVTSRSVFGTALQPAGALVEKGVRVGHVQRFSPRLTLDVNGRLSDAHLNGAVGAKGMLGAGVTLQPFAEHELLLSASADVGFTQAAAEGSGAAAGVGARAGYGRALGPVRAGAFVGGGTQYCGCVGLTAGFLSSLDTGVSLGSVGFQNVDLRADYRLSAVDAPMGRGGRRLEHHATVSGRVRLGAHVELVAQGGYDDGFRDFIDLTTGSVGALHEQAFFVGGTAAVSFQRGSVSLDARHGRGNALIPNSPFVAGPPPAARAVTALNLTAYYPALPFLDLTAGANAQWTALDDVAPLSNVGGSAGATLRLGRITLALVYQLTRADALGFLTTQHFLRAQVSRPFELEAP